MVTMNWTKDGQGRLTLAWKPEDRSAREDRAVRAYHKAVRPAFKTRRPARRFLRTLPLTAVVS